MIRYKVARRCHGFKGRMWEEGQIVDLEDNDIPPYHFVRTDESPITEVKTEPLVALSDMGKIPEVKGGMNAGLEKPVEPVKRGRKKT